MTRRLSALFAALLCAPLLAQTSCPTNYSQVTITQLGALQALQTGLLTVVATDGSGNPINYSVPGVGIETFTPKRDPIVDGALVNSLCLARTDRTSVPVQYHITARDTSPAGGNRIVLDASGVTITADTFDLDAYPFNQSTSATLQNVVLAGLAASSQTPGGTLNGNNTVFSLTGGPSAGLLYRNGVLQEPSVDYNLSNGGNTLTFNSAPQAGDVLIFVAITYTSTSANAVPGSFAALTGSPFDSPALNTALNTIEAGKASFSQLAGSPFDNTSLAAALNARGTGAGTVTSVSVGTGWPSWLTPTFANASTAATANATVAPIPNSALQNSSITINGQPTPLGGTVSIAVSSPPPSAGAIQAVLEAQNGCSTTGYVYSPQAGTCISGASTPTANGVQAALATQSGCTTAGTVYSPVTNTCVAQSAGGSTTASSIQTALEAQTGCTTSGTVYSPLSNSCVALPSGGTTTASSIQTALEAQTGCTTAGTVYSPVTNSCVAQPTAGTTTASSIQTALEAQTGCTTAGTVYSPVSNSCVAQPTGGTTTASSIQTALEAQTGCTTAGTVYSPVINSCVAQPTGGTTTASSIQAALSSQTGCSVAGYVYSPQSNSCVAQSSGGSSITLTTNGSSGAATLSGGVLNIPQYAVSGGTSFSSLPQQEFKRVTDASMFSFITALTNCANQVVNIYALTDSRGVVFNSDGSGEGPDTFLHRYLDLYNLKLQALTGCPSHGTGYVPYTKFLVPNSPNPNNEFYYGATSFSGYDTGYGPTQTNPGSSTVWAPVAVFASGGGFHWQTTSLIENVDTVRSLCLTGPSFGTWTFAIASASGTSLGSFTCGGNSTSETAVSASSSTFASSQVVVTATCSGGSCEIYAMEGSLGSAGIELHNLGAASAAAEMYNQSSSSFAFIDLMPAANLLITDFGTNDGALGFTTSQYQTALTTIGQHFKSQSTAPSVMITFPPVSNNGTSAGTYASFAAAALSAAQTVGAGYENTEDQWGTAFLPALFGGDGIHPNTLGSHLEYSLLLGSTVDLATMSAGVSSSTSTVNPGSGTPGALTAGAHESSPYFAANSTDGNWAVTFTSNGSAGSGEALFEFPFANQSWSPTCSIVTIAPSNSSAVAITLQAAKLGGTGLLNMIAFAPSSGLPAGTYTLTGSCSVSNSSSGSGSGGGTSSAGSGTPGAITSGVHESNMSFSTGATDGSFTLNFTSSGASASEDMGLYAFANQSWSPTCTVTSVSPSNSTSTAIFFQPARVNGTLDNIMYAGTSGLAAGTYSISGTCQ